MITTNSSEQYWELIKATFMNSYANYILAVLFSIFLIVLIIQFLLMRKEYKKYNVQQPYFTGLIHFVKK